MASVETDSVDGLDAQNFDYVISGGGTAGLVVANRLSEDPNTTVLVLEAGSNHLDDDRLLILGLVLSVHQNPEYDWSFWSAPQDQLNGCKLMGTKGKTLGGSSAINFGNIIFPSKVGMNTWESLGNPGWGWDDFAPYIKKFHTGTGPSEQTRNFLKGVKWRQEDQGTSGPVRVSYGEDHLPYHAAWLETFKNLGFELTDDPIKGAGVGPFINPGAIDPETHTRSHAGIAYYKPVQRRHNLRVVTHAYVERIFLQQTDNLVMATGVQASIAGKRYDHPAPKEVILAAGASQSSQLLELSRIGDADRLQSFGINTLIDNKGVGENVQDHANVSFAYEVAEGMPSTDKMREPDFAASVMESFRKFGRGPYTVMPCVPAFMPYPDSEESRAALVSKITTPPQEAKMPGQRKQDEAIRQILDKNEPSCQYILSPGQISARAGTGPKEIYGPWHEGYFISITAILSYPLSRGSIHLQSSDPQDTPRIDYGLLRHPADLELLARHARWMDKIPQTEPLASLLKRGGQRLHDP